MASLDIIRKRGFRVWYERQLIETHAWLVTCFLGIIATASGVEIFGQHTAASRSTGILLIFGGIAAGLVHGIATAACWILPSCWASGQFVLPATLMENSGCWIPVPPRSPKAATPTSTISDATSGFAPNAKNAPTNGLCNPLPEYL